MVAIGAMVLNPQDLLAQDESAFRKSDIVRLVVSDTYSDAEKATMIRSNCLSFEPTARDWHDLRAMEMAAPVLGAIESCVRSSGIPVEAAQNVRSAAEDRAANPVSRTRVTLEADAAPEPQAAPVPAARFAATSEPGKAAFELQVEAIALTSDTVGSDIIGLDALNVCELRPELTPPAGLAAIKHADERRVSGEDLEVGRDELARRDRKTADNEPPMEQVESEIGRHVRLGQQALATGQAGAAITYFRAALSSQPRNLIAQTGLARAYLLSGDSDNAVLYFHAATSRASNSAELWRELSEALAAAGKSDEARQASARAAELDPESKP